MLIAHWLTFVLATAILLAIPGPTVLTVVSYALAHGRRVALLLVISVTLGDATALSMSLLGLGALLAASAFWFTVVKWIGGLYLLWLGWRMLRTGVHAHSLPVLDGPTPPGRLFARTFLVTALNPKSIVFLTAFLPQFVSPTKPAAPQLALLAATFLVMAACGSLLYALFAASAREVFRSRQAQRGMHLGGGALLSAAGIWALMARRPT